MVGVQIPYMPLLKVLGYVHMYVLIWHPVVQTDSYFLVCLNKEFSLFLVVGSSLFHALLP